MAIVAVVGADLWVLTQRNATTTVGLEDALADFRSGGSPATTASSFPSDAVAPAVPGGETAAAPGGPAQLAVVEPVVAETPARLIGGAVEPAPTADRTAPALAPVAPLPYLLPAEGVYAYRTTGGESISLAGARHAYPERTFSTVRHHGGCAWQQRFDVIREHVDIRELCGEPGRLLADSQTRQIEFFGARDGGTQVCDPSQLLHAVGEAPGAVTTATCHGDDGSHATMARTFVGVDVVDVGGATVEVVHLRITADLTGRVQGSSIDELWLVATTGLPVRWDRTVDTLADAAFGARVRYQEDASFVLESLEPAT